MNRSESTTSERSNIIRDAPVFPEEWYTQYDPAEVFEVKSVATESVGEVDLFARHAGIPAHDQRALEHARFGIVGAGGLNGAAALALVRSGARYLTVMDHDRAEVSNLARQFFYKEDLGLPKGIRLARNLQTEMISGGSITGIGLSFEEALEEHPIQADIFVVGVDNNACRLSVVREARRRGIPATFSMLSSDGMRGNIFLQGPSDDEACLFCALPDLDPHGSMPCVSAIISACFLVAACTVFFVHRAVMGWGKMEPFNWREVDLTGCSAERIGRVTKRDDCPVCSGR